LQKTPNDYLGINRLTTLLRAMDASSADSSWIWQERRCTVDQAQITLLAFSPQFLDLQALRGLAHRPRVGSGNHRLLTSHFPYRQCN
jgi:hypothetical protein